MSHFEQAEALLKAQKVDRRRPSNEELLYEASIHATLAVAEELQKMNARLKDAPRPIGQAEISG